MMLSTDEILTEKILVQLPNGAIIKFEVSDFGREDVASDVMNFNDIAPALEGIITAIKGIPSKFRGRDYSGIHDQPKRLKEDLSRMIVPKDGIWPI
jgi:hypothetical protein